jgi:hypothetical protein
MKGMNLIRWFLLAHLLQGLFLVATARQEVVENGPQVKAFLDLCRHEEKELEFQIAHHEISRKDYVRSKNRIAIQRQMVLKFVKESAADIVPDLHVVTTAEVGQLIEEGMQALRAAKPGAIIGKKWRYHGSVNRGEAYYILERLKDLSNVTRPRTVTRNSP